MIERIHRALGARAPHPPSHTEGKTPAAVLVPVFEKDGEVHLLFTRRTDSVRDHKGEISFPGGRQDPEDASAVATALREAEEEVGIAPRDVRILGALDPITTITSYLVRPFVGEISYPYAFRPNEHEIAEILEVPLAALLDPGAHRVEQGWNWEGAPYPIHYYWWRDHVIWGATAKILKGLIERAFGGGDEPGGGAARATARRATKSDGSRGA